jgi:hypothetical protein
VNQSPLPNSSHVRIYILLDYIILFKVDIYEKDHIGFDVSGFFYSEIYDEVQSRFDGYVTSIATTDEVEGEDYDGAAL